MPAPTRYPSGVSTFNAKDNMNKYPQVRPPMMAGLDNEFTYGRVGSAAAGGGVVGPPPGRPDLIRAQLPATAGASVTLQGLGNQQTFLLQPGQRSFWQARVAFATNAGAGTNQYDYEYLGGVFNATAYAAGLQGLWFRKPYGTSRLDFILASSVGAYWFQGVGDVAQPSGIFNDTSDQSLVLGGVISGGALTSLNQQQAGFGYAATPLAAGRQGLSGAWVDLLMGSSIANAAIRSAGSGGTNGTYASNLVDVMPVHDLSIVYNGGNFLEVGINGKRALAIGIEPNFLPTNPAVPGYPLGSASLAYPVASGSALVGGSVLTGLGPRFHSNGLGPTETGWLAAPQFGSAMAIMPFVGLYSQHFILASSITGGAGAATGLAPGGNREVYFIDSMYGFERN